MFVIRNRFKKLTCLSLSATLALITLAVIPNTSFASCAKLNEAGTWQQISGNSSIHRVKVIQSNCEVEWAPSAYVTTWSKQANGGLFNRGVVNGNYKRAADGSEWLYSVIGLHVYQWVKWYKFSNQDYLRVWTNYAGVNFTTDEWFQKTISQPGRDTLGRQLSELRNNQAGRCLDGDLGSINMDGGIVQSWGCWNGRNQNWYIHNDGSIVNLQSGKCLDADLGSINQDGTKVQLWSCWGGLNQKWIRNKNGTITNAQSGRCLDVDLGNINRDGSKVQLWSCWGGKNQLWEGEHY